MLLIDSQLKFEAAPCGVFASRLITLADLGTQKVDFQGEIKRQRKLLMTFELLGDERMTNGEPFKISRRFTLSLHEKAALRVTLEAWRSRKFTPDEVKAGIPLEKMLGAYALLTLIESEREGKTYSNIASISSLPKGMPKPDGVGDLILFDLNAPDWQAFDKLSKKTQETIMASPEGIKAFNGRGSSATAASDPFADLAEDIPF